MNQLMNPIDAHRVSIETLDQSSVEYGYELMTNVYSKQDIADRLEELYSTKHHIEHCMKLRSLTSYETKKFTNAVGEIQQLLSILLKDFKEEV